MSNAPQTDSRRSDLDSVSRYSKGQHGLFTRAQAAQLNITAERLASYVDDGALEQFQPDYCQSKAEPSSADLFRFARHPHDDFEEIWAAYLQTDPVPYAHHRMARQPDLVVSHLSAAEITGLCTLLDVPPTFTLISSTGNLAEPPGVFVREPKLPLIPSDFRLTSSGLYATTPLRTLADVLGDDVEQSAILDIAAGVQPSNQRRVNELLGDFAARRGRPDGVSFLRDLQNIAAQRFQTPVREASRPGISAL